MRSLLSRLASRTRFRCNVCGATNELPRAQIARESAPCARCQNYVRLRAMAGLTLEFRVFSRSGLLRALEGAGFAIADVFDDAIRAHGIPLRMHEVVVVAERPRAGQANARASAR